MVGEGDDQLWGSDVVPLLGAIVVCYGGGGEGDRQLRGSGRGDIAGCHCRVPLQCARGGEGDDQTLGGGRGAIAGC